MIRVIPKRRTGLRLGLILVIALAPLALLLVPGFRPRDVLLRHWRQQLAGAPQEETVLRLQQIASLGDDGLPLLVEAMARDERPLADAAYGVLNKQLDQWQLLGSQDSSPSVARLARLLAAASGRGGQPARRRFSELALRILLWPVDRRSVAMTQLVSDCEAVLRWRCDDPAGPQATAIQPRVELSDDPASAAESATGQDARSLSDRSASLAADPLPAEIADVPPLPRAASEATGRQSSQENAPGDGSIGQGDRPWAEDVFQAALDGPAGGQETKAVARVPDDSSIPMSAVRPEQLARLPDVAVMRGLVADDTSAADAARNELRRRGYQPVHLELAKRLVDPDPAVRVALVDALPQVAAVDARPWLLWLTRDKEVSVRKAAIGVIATSHDPALREELRRLEGEEADPDVLRLVRRVLSGNKAE